MKSMNRKTFINISLLALFSSSSSCFGDYLFLSNQKNEISTPNNVLFSPKEFEILSAIADTLIPNTDTPGAISAGVPAFIDSMMNNWASSEQRLNFRNSLRKIHESLNIIAGDFVKANYKTRFHALNTFDKEIFSDGGDDNYGYKFIKEIIVDVYYKSEIGASEELIYDANPGVWKPCVPFSQVGRSWAI